MAPDTLFAFPGTKFFLIPQTLLAKCFRNFVTLHIVLFSRLCNNAITNTTYQQHIRDLSAFSGINSFFLSLKAFPCMKFHRERMETYGKTR